MSKLVAQYVCCMSSARLCIRVGATQETGICCSRLRLCPALYIADVHYRYLRISVPGFESASVRNEWHLNTFTYLLTMALHAPNSTEQKEIVKILCCTMIPNLPLYTSFLKFYVSVTCMKRASDSFVTVDPPLFRSRADILHSAETLRTCAEYTRDQFQSAAFPEVDDPLQRQYATRMIVGVAFMIDCDSRDDFSDGYRIAGSFPIKWHPHQRFTDFLQCAFPTSVDSSSQSSLSSSFSSSPSSYTPVALKPGLKAWKLTKRYGIRFIPTNDLVQHLLYDRDKGTVKVFHQTAFLKAHLRHTAACGLCESFKESVSRYTRNLLDSHQNGTHTN
jgi:hypothetical protein